MTSSGRCHGPGCTREARVEFFCSETCQDRWNSGLERLTPAEDRESAAKRALAHLLDWQRADLALRAVCPPARLEDAKAAAFERHAYLGLAEAFRSVADDLAVGWLPPSRGAAFPQVASESPQVASRPDHQVGWLARLFDRLFGRTT